MKRLEQYVVVVTGGAHGIGQAIVRKCAREGAHVVFFDIDADEAAATLTKLTDESLSAGYLNVDITREEQVQVGIERVLGRFNSIDVLVNNAGVNTYFDAAEMTEAQWDAVFAVGLKGAWLCAKHVLPVMKAQGRGSIVNISSIHSTLTMAGMFPYAAAKMGLIGLTRSLALDYAPFGIRVNAVSPGWTRTRLIEEWFARQADPIAAEEAILRAHPLGRLATPDEVANLVAFVASDEASAITGAALNVDCGLSIVQAGT